MATRLGWRYIFPETSTQRQDGFVISASLRPCFAPFMIFWTITISTTFLVWKTRPVRILQSGSGKSSNQYYLNYRGFGFTKHVLAAVNIEGTNRHQYFQTQHRVLSLVGPSGPMIQKPNHSRTMWNRRAALGGEIVSSE